MPPSPALQVFGLLPVVCAVVATCSRHCPLAAPCPDLPAPMPPLSRTAAKRARRQEARALRLKQRRAARRLKPEKVPAGASNGYGYQAVGLRVAELERRRRARQAMRWTGGPGAGLRVIVDMSFGALMNPSEVRSLAQQVHRCYSINLALGRAGSPPPPEGGGLCVSHHPSISNQAAPPGHELPAGHARLALAECSGAARAALCRINGWDDWGLAGLSSAGPASVSQLLASADTDTRRIIMLSPDAVEPLDGVGTGDVIVIGGLCDAKRIVGASLERSLQLGIEARRLPLQEWAHALAEHVMEADAVAPAGAGAKPAFVDILTVDQVFAIVLELANNGNDWLSALATHLPQRKQRRGSKGSKAGKSASPQVLD